MKRSLAAMLKDQEHVDRREVDRGDGEEVDRPGDIHVVSQERQPRSRRLSWLASPYHVLVDRFTVAGFIGWARSSHPFRNREITAHTTLNAGVKRSLGSYLRSMQVAN